MAKKKTARKTRGRKAVRKAPPTAANRIRAAWADALAAVGTAEANLEREVKKLLRRSRISTRDAATMLADVRALADRERRKASKVLLARAADLQARVKKERRVAGRALDDAVRSALAALNIPSRAEVAALTRKVDQLSRQMQRRR